jgi:hypothetical protein
VIVEMAGEIAGVEQEIRTFDAVATTNAQRLFQYFDVIRAEARTDSTWFVAGDRLRVPLEALRSRLAAELVR